MHEYSTNIADCRRLITRARLYYHAEKLRFFSPPHPPTDFARRPGTSRTRAQNGRHSTVLLCLLYSVFYARRFLGAPENVLRFARAAVMLHATFEIIIRIPTTTPSSTVWITCAVQNVYLGKICTHLSPHMPTAIVPVPISRCRILYSVLFFEKFSGHIFGQYAYSRIQFYFENLCKNVLIVCFVKPVYNIIILNPI